jgi:hypothetical protein
VRLAVPRHLKTSINQRFLKFLFCFLYLKAGTDMTKNILSSASRFLVFACAALTIVSCSSDDPVIRGPAADNEAPPTKLAACPSKDSAGAALAVDVPANTMCYTGTNSQGSNYIIAMPPNWNGRLLLHTHGGPDTVANPDRAVDLFDRWDIMVRSGYALAGTAFRPGFEARRAAEDTERLRGIFRQHIARPSMTILHGQSWGAEVAVRAAEIYTLATVGEQPYDAVLLSAGVLAGGTRSYDFRMDLRAVYQYYCKNHPRPSETQYALNLGFPVDAAQPNVASVTTRVNECLALNKPADQRTADQKANLANILGVIKTDEANLTSHLAWGTRQFQTISKAYGGSPFGNTGASYSGSTNDTALNAGVQRFVADTAAYRRFAEDSDPAGRIPVPVLSVKWSQDPTAWPELDAHFKTVMQAGGSADRLVQTFTTAAESHSYISDATYVTLLGALVQWVQSNQKPTPATVAQACPAVAAEYPAGVGCKFDPAYVPAPLESRVPARQRPLLN